MIETLAPAALAALLAAAPARAAEPPKEKRFVLRLEASALGGAFDGQGVRTDQGGLAVVEIKASPEIRGERWWLDVPFRVKHRQTIGADLSETTGAVDVEPWYQASKRVRIGVLAGAFGASRPGWPDLYQRDSTGDLAPTDRYGYLAWRAGVQLYARPAPHQHLRARYRYVSYDFVQDPAFDELDPMHLTPRDRARHELDLSWRYHQEAWAVALRLDASREAYGTLLARDRVTGSSAGNPKQELNDLEPSVELELTRMGGRLDLSFQYGLEILDDPFQGYYSYTGHHPRVLAKFAFTDRLVGRARYEGWYRTYGADGPDVPPLEIGATRREDNRTALGAEVAYRLGGRLSAVAEAEWVTRSTNYADYVPPPDGTSSYDIQWDYTNLSFLAGVRYEL